MDWITRLNQALAYIEEHLDGKIELEQAAKLAYCSTYHFQRMFTYLAGIPLSEYIRRRRMTPVSYTHLDVYKRQCCGRSTRSES